MMGAIPHLRSRRVPERPSHPVVIVTALDVETRAVLRQLRAWQPEKVDGTGFFVGTFEGRKVAVVEAGPGNASAAAIAVRALRALLKPRSNLQDTAHELEQRARVVRQQDSWKKRLDPKLKHPGPTIYVAPIAAGEKVVSSQRSTTAKLIKQHYGDTLAVEMEGRGFLQGVHISHPVKGCVVRGISDLLSNKEEADKAGSQQIAANVASAAAFEMLSGLKGGASAAMPKPAFVEMPAAFSKGAYFQKGEVLAEVGVPNVDQVSFSFTAEPDGYMRIIPMTAQPRPIPVAALNAAVGQAELIRATGFGGIDTVNRYGAILYALPVLSGWDRHRCNGRHRFSRTASCGALRTL